MPDIASDLQRALFARLTTYAPLTALIGIRAFDRVPDPENPAYGFPYVTIFDVFVMDDRADCITGSDVDFDIHVWSQAVGSTEAKAIAGHVRSALDQYDLDLGADHALVDLSFRNLRVMRDPDGLTTHAVVSFRALTETPEE